MTESLLIADVQAFLIAHSYGAAHAMPRRHLLHHLNMQGHSICDRRLRKVYGQGGPLEGKVGSSLRGLFWIVTAEDRRVAQSQLDHPAKAMLVREKTIREAGMVGQGELFRNP